MSREMNRREFLKASAITGGVLMAGDILRGPSSIAHGSVKLPEIEKVVITVIADNYYDTLRPSTKFAQRFYIGPGTCIHAEHGLSYHIEAVVNGKSHDFMFDYGVDFYGVTKNMDLLDIDVKRLEALGLSHGHWDHWGNLTAILKHFREKLPKEIPLYVGEEAFAHRFSKRPDRITDIGQLSKEEIERLGFVKIMEIKDPTPIVPGGYLTGNIERVTDYEKGSPTSLVKRGDKMEQDIFGGEQGLVFNVRGKGLVVVTSCAHAGVVNTTRHAQKMTGIEKVHAVLGGFHLPNAKPELIQRTVADIKAIAPRHIVPMHCTGFEAVTAFAREMPEQFFLNTSGTKYIFAA